jgi:hypothetical protein
MAKLLRQTVISFCSNKLSALGVDGTLCDYGYQAQRGHFFSQAIRNFMCLEWYAVVSAPFNFIGRLFKERVAAMSDYRVGLLFQYLDNPLHTPGDFSFIHVYIVANRRLGGNTGFPVNRTNLYLLRIGI